MGPEYQRRRSESKGNRPEQLAISDGRLVKSHVDCTVTFDDKSGGARTEPAPRANIKIDISLGEKRQERIQM